jgi:ribonuclease D
MPAEPLRVSWVTDADGMEEMCRCARAAGAISLDTESDSLHSYFHKLCLMQVSCGGKNGLLDPLLLRREDLAPLVALFADPSVEKLLHGADYDLRVLDRDLGVRAMRVRDTQIAAQLLGEPRTGLAAMLELEFGVVLDKRFQRADWGHRPLGPELEAYAAADTAYLEPLRNRLKARLEALGRRSWWEEECAVLESVRWEPPVPDELDFERIRGARKLKGAARDRIAALHRWRESRAAEQDVPPFRILNAEPMLALAENPPADLGALAGVKGVGRSLVRRHGADLLQLLAHAPTAPPPVARVRTPRDREREARVQRAREVRDTVAGTLAIEPGVLAPRAGLELFAERVPGSRDELVACLGRQWRSDVLAELLLPLAATWREGALAGQA